MPAVDATSRTQPPKAHELYAIAAQVERESPGLSHEAVARRTGASKDQIRRFRRDGIPSLGLPPLAYGGVVESIIPVTSRLRDAVLPRGATEPSVYDAVATQAAEAILAELQRRDARGRLQTQLDVQAKAGHLLTEAVEIAEWQAKKMREAMANPDAKASDVKPSALCRVIDTVSDYTKKTAEVALMAVELERKIHGEPDIKVAVTVTAERAPEVVRGEIAQLAMLASAIEIVDD